MPLFLPGTRIAANVKLKKAAALSKLRNKCVIFGSGDVCELRM